MRTKLVISHWSLVIGLLLCGFSFGATVMVDTNGVVYHPTNFWAASGAEQMMIDIAASTVDTEVPSYLTDYYTAAQSDARYRQISAADYASQVQVVRTNLQNITGYTVQQCLEAIDDLLTNSGGGTVITTNTTNTVVIGGASNATQISVSFTPVEYTPATNTVESHLIAIDARLAYLNSLITNLSTSTPETATLTGLTLTGNNLAYESSTEYYTLTATYSDASSRDVSSEGVWTMPGGAPSGTTLISSNLTVGSLTWNTSVTVRAEYSWLGDSIAREKTVQLQDTNPPTLQGVTLTGSSVVNERTEIWQKAWAVYDQGISNDVSSSAVFGFSSAVPDGTAWTGNVLYAGSVLTNTPITITAQYGGETGSRTVTVQNTEQHMLFTVNNSTPYNSGTIYIHGYDNAAMQGYPVWALTFPYDASMYGSYSSNILSTDIRQVGTGQYEGETYWFAFLDTDGNGYVNGTVNLQSSTIPLLRTDEPNTIMDGQTASSGCSLSVNSSSDVSFTLNSENNGFSYVVQAIPSGGQPVKKVVVANVNGQTFVTSYITNRPYLCEQDFLIHGASLSGTATYRCYIYNMLNEVSTDPRYWGRFPN
jgi:hypothetical protein